MRKEKEICGRKMGLCFGSGYYGEVNVRNTNPDISVGAPECRSAPSAFDAIDQILEKKTYLPQTPVLFNTIMCFHSKQNVGQVD